MRSANGARGGGLKDGIVGVLMGGRSAERDVSLATGAAVLGALGRLGYRAVGIDVGPGIARRLALLRVGTAFVALHGRGGEDGTMQGMLEVLGIPYTGSGVLASALAMNKRYSKLIFGAHKLPTPDFEVFTRGTRGARLARLALPVVVKPACEGSSIGMSIVRSKASLPRELAKAFRYDDEALVEAYVPGRDLTVGILGEEALPVVEIRPRGGFYDYRAKYKKSGTTYIVPAPIPPRTARRVQDLALAAHRALGCRGASRVDFRLDDRGRPWLLEVNTIPGMTATSLLPKSAAAVGIGFEELVERILLGARCETVSPRPGSAGGAR